MPTTKRLKGLRARVPAGDLDTPVWLEDRVQTPPTESNADAGFQFAVAHTVAELGATKTWARVLTQNGRTAFDGVDAERRVTHTVTFRRVSGITAETWIRLKDGTRLDIVDIEDLDERGLFLHALCEATGRVGKEASGQ